MITHATLLRALEKPYDYISARAILRQTLTAAQMEERERYNKVEVAQFLDALKRVERRKDRVGKVAAELGEDVPNGDATPAASTPPAKAAAAPTATDTSAADAAPAVTVEEVEVSVPPILAAADADSPPTDTNPDEGITAETATDSDEAQQKGGKKGKKK